MAVKRLAWSWPCNEGLPFRQTRYCSLLREELNIFCVLRWNIGSLFVGQSNTFLLPATEKALYLLLFQSAGSTQVVGLELHVYKVFFVSVLKDPVSQIGQAPNNEVRLITSPVQLQYLISTNKHRDINKGIKGQQQVFNRPFKTGSSWSLSIV